ncbi:MAG: hypothetical protein WA945_10860 [Arcobacteraceae bacterium]
MYFSKNCNNTDVKLLEPINYWESSITNMSDEQIIKVKHLAKELYKLEKIIRDEKKRLKPILEKRVSGHYLALDFNEDYLQGSSWGEPIDKWRKFFNEDLETLNESLKKYLQLFSYLGFEGEYPENVLSQYYQCKVYYGFVRDEYNVGFVAPCSTILKSTILNTKVENDSCHIMKFEKLDLATYEQRVALKEDIEQKNGFLKIEYKRLQDYIKAKYTLDDLL